MENIISLLAADNYLVVNRDLARELGLNTAILLGELCSEHNYYEKTGQLEGGWFYSTIENVESYTTLGEKAQRTAIKALEEAGFLECVVRGIPAKRYFKLNTGALSDLIFGMTLPKIRTLDEILDETSSDQNANPVSTIDETSSGKKTKPVPAKVRTNNNKEIIITKEEKKKGKKFVPPTLEEVNAYITEKSLSVDGKTFIDYYEAGDWIDGNGKPVKNWKQKLLTWVKFNNASVRPKKPSVQDSVQYKKATSPTTDIYY